MFVVKIKLSIYITSEVSNKTFYFPQSNICSLMYIQVINQV